MIRIAFELCASRRPIWFLFVGLLFVSPFHAQEPPGKNPNASSWSILSLRIEKKLTSVDLDGTGDGTWIRAKIEMAERLIVGVDSEASKLDTWNDDKGTNLLATPLRMQGWKTLERDRIAKDGKSATVFLKAGGLPALGASKIHLKGKVAVLVGKDEKKIEKQNVYFLAGADLEFGKVKYSGGLTNRSFTYVGNRPIKEAVVDVEGKTMPLDILTTKASIQADGKAEFHIALLPHPFDKTILNRGTLRITYFDAVEKIMVPFDLEIGLGL